MTFAPPGKALREFPGDGGGSPRCNGLWLPKDDCRGSVRFWRWMTDVPKVTSRQLGFTDPLANSQQYYGGGDHGCLNYG